MLSEHEIAEALHAARVVPLSVANPHGPLGLEQLAATIGQLNAAAGARTPRIRRPIELDDRTWAKLDELAEKTGQKKSQRYSASQVASAIVEQYVSTLSAKSEVAS
jgi:hypothetical protein